MKRIICSIFLLVSFLSFSQNERSQIVEIAESEAKTAASISAFSPNSNTGNYDVTYHQLEFTLDPNVAFISGIVTTTFTAKESLSQIIFDLDDNMTVTSVTQNSTSVSFMQNSNDELIITLLSTLNQGDSSSVSITYSGNPQSSGFGAFEQTTHNGDPIIWTLSEPYGAKSWWPCKQDLNDKIDLIDVYITTPELNPSSEEYIAVSNGVEQSQSVNGGFKTTHYRHQYAIPAYLIAIAVTNYEVYSETVPNNGNPFDIVNYVFPESLSNAQSSTPVTVDIMNLFTNLFEEYPFASEKYGHAQFGWGGGMEHTTVSFMGNFSRDLIAHELAHQWFGNKVTCGSWQDIWLNEGFATYLTGLVYEDIDGDASFNSWKQGRINHITSSTSGSVHVPASDTLSVGRVFSSRLSYNKGAMVLHMLRKKLGDTDFYQGTQDYLSDANLAFGYAKTEDFIPIMEAQSGQDLTEFFNDWVYNEGYPSYTVNWHQPNANQVSINLNQTQSHASVSFFEVNVPLRIIGSGGEILDVVLDNTSDNQTFMENVTFTVSDILFDPNYDIISRNNSVTLGFNEAELETQIKVYPTVTSSEIRISKPQTIDVNKVVIYNMLGQNIMTIDYSETINVEQLSSGLHFIELHINSGIIYKSMLKQ